MKNSFKIDKKSIGLRIDKWIKQNIGKLPQSLIEKSLRKGKIKLNNKKVKSSIKLKENDILSLYNLNFKLNIIEKKKFEPSNKILKKNEKSIIDENQDFLVINKESEITVQGGTKSKKNIIDIFQK
jgi:Pseudouridylate synthases, 23S RNA-specific